MGSQTLKYLFLFSLLILGVACEEVDKEDHDSEGSALEETFTRRLKRVVRYNCKGKVTSDKVETINSVSKQFSLKPKKKKDLYNFVATNETTDSTHGSIWFDKGVFTLDLAPTVFNIDAVEGMNKIAWKFLYCHELKEDNSCKHVPENKESGVTFIHIRQERVFEDGVMEVKPTAEQCKP